MSIRSLVLVSSVVTVFSLALPARADVPNPTTGSGGSSSTSAAATGAGGGVTSDPNCSVAEQQDTASTCQLCSTGKGTAPAMTASCSSLDNTYFLACQQNAAVQVWCNGPQRLAPSDQNVSCTVAAPSGAWSSLGACGALAAAAALLMRRRRS